MVNVVRSLGLSKAAAFFRMKAAELIQRHPAVIEPLRDGRLCLTTVASLARVLTAQNGRPAPLLPPLQAGGEGDRRRAAPRREPSAPDGDHDRPRVEPADGACFCGD